MKNVKSVILSIDHAESIICIILFVIMVITSFTQVLNRNIFHLPLSWLEEASRFSMIFMAFIGAEMGLRDGSQIAVTGVVNKFHGIPRLILDVISKILVILFSAAVTIGAYRLMKVQYLSGQVSASLHIPMWIPYLVMVITFALTTVLQVFTVFIMLVETKSKQSIQEGDEI